MELLQKIKTFKNANGQDVNYNAYYVVVLGEEIELKPVYATDRKLLKAGFKNGRK